MTINKLGYQIKEKKILRNLLFFGIFENYDFSFELIKFDNNYQEY